MKLILEIEDKSYPTILDFISLLPENKCRVLADETAKLNAQNTPESKQNLPLHKYKLLPLGTTLLVALTIKSGLSEELKSKLSRNNYKLGNGVGLSKLSVNTQFIEVTIGDPTALQKSSKEIDEGGLFILFKGLNQTGVLTSSIKLPLQENGKNVIADSLNYAFTLLSIEYEPWRKSHTGNIYDRIFYKEKNEKWYPIDVLRNFESIKQDEHQSAFKARQEAIKTIAVSH